MYIGNKSATDSAFSGYIQEVMIFDSILSDEELKSIYHYLSMKWQIEAGVDSDADGIVDQDDSDFEGSSYAYEDAEYSVDLNFTDVENDALTFTVTNQPSWATFTEGTQRLSGIPTNDDLGDIQNIRITATDPDGLSEYYEYDLTVLNTNDLPILEEPWLHPSQKIVCQLQIT